jgi:hypothetical protein
MTTPNAAADTAARAAEVAAKLKPGTYDAVQALSFLSIAQSLSRIADALDRQNKQEE